MNFAKFAATSPSRRAEARGFEAVLLGSSHWWRNAERLSNHLRGLPEVVQFRIALTGTDNGKSISRRITSVAVLEIIR